MAPSGVRKSAESVLGSWQEGQREDGLGPTPKWGCDQIRFELIDFKPLMGMTSLECYQINFSVA